MIHAVITGFFTALGLIVAIGAQNAFVLRQGLRGEHVLPVVAICVTADLILIAAGIAGLGVIVRTHPDAVSVARWAGAGFLFCYAALAGIRATRPGSLTPQDQRSPSLRATVLLCLAFTYLNPHVYLDTVLLLGTVANQGPRPWCFWSGAALASLGWFATLGFGARILAPVLARPGAWRVLDALVALLMLAVGWSLIVG